MNIDPSTFTIIASAAGAATAVGGIVWALVRFGIKINEGERRAKHAAIDAMNAPIGFMELHKLDKEVWQTDRNALELRLKRIERALRLDGRPIDDSGDEETPQ